MNSQFNQLPVGLIAQLVEHCTGNAEVMGSNLVQAWIFQNCSSCVYNCDDQIAYSFISISFKYMLFHLIIHL